MPRAKSLVGAEGFGELMVERDKEDLKEGILIFTDQKTLAHKQDDGMKKDEEFCYWETNKIPKKFVETFMLEKSPRVSFEQSRYSLIKEFPIYFTVKGKIKGYFMVERIEEEIKLWLIFHSESWAEIKHGEVLKPSQGWRYYPKTKTNNKGA